MQAALFLGTGLDKQRSKRLAQTFPFLLDFTSIIPPDPYSFCLMRIDTDMPPNLDAQSNSEEVEFREPRKNL